MASRKEYEMSFKLSSQLGGNFSKTFQSAQSDLLKMQQQIEALNKVQSDITAYQKQQAAVDATTQKMAVLQQQYDNIQREIDETEGFSSSLENRLLSKQQQIDKTSAALENQTSKLKQMESALESAGVDVNDLEKEQNELKEETDKLKESEEKFADSGVSAFEAVSSAITAAGVAKALQEIYEAYSQCVTIAADFESTMSTVEALSGAASAEMDALSEAAKELGATTVYTAQEAAQAMTYMGMAGWEAEDMLSGMDGVLQLAAASGEDLATVSDIVTDNLTAFGLSASDTAHFSDVLAAAATNSNTSVSIMGETFKQSASIAGALGYSIDDVAVSVGLMANAGVKGSTAGTALKNTFNGLLEGVTLTSDAFGEYEFTATKADGTMKSYKDTVDELRGVFEQMSDAEKVANAQAIAGNRAYNGLLAIINATDEDYQSLTESIQNCTGAASEMAAIKLDNMNGQLTLMNSAWEAVQTTIGEQFTPTMRKLYEIITNVLTSVNGFIGDHPALVKALAALIGSIGALVAGMTAYAAIMKVIKALDLKTMFANPFFLAAAGAAVLVSALVGVVTAVKNTNAEYKAMTATTKEQYDELQELNAEYERACEEYGATSEEASRLKYQVDDLTESFEANRQTVEEFQEEIDALCSGVYELSDSWDEAQKTSESTEIGTLALIQKYADLTKQQELNEVETQALIAVTQTLRETYPDLTAQLDSATLSTEDYVAALKAAAEQEAKTRMQEESYETYVQAIQKRDELLEAQEEAQENLNAELERTGYYYDEQGNITNGYVNVGGLIADWTTDLDEYNDALNEVNAAFEENEAIIAEVEGTWKQAAETTSEMEDAISDVNDAVLELGEAYTDAYNLALESIQGQFDLWDEAKTEAKAIDDVTGAISSQIEYWNDYNSNLQALGDRASEIEGLAEVLDTLMDGSSDSVGMVAGMAAASDADLQKMVESYQKLQDAQGTTADTIAQMQADVTETMEQLQTDIEGIVEDMDLGVEASESAIATMQGYIDGATSMAPAIQEAYAAVGASAIAALQGKITEANALLSNGNLSIGTYDNLIGRASGTENAPSGYAWVGEQGPELVKFNGGEKVINAVDSARAALYADAGGGSGAQIQFAPVFNISGVSDAEGVRQALNSVTDDLRGYILDVVNEEAGDRARRVYS